MDGLFVGILSATQYGCPTRYVDHLREEIRRRKAGVAQQCQRVSGDGSLPRWQAGYCIQQMTCIDCFKF
jgi:hypothetical protein